MLIEQTLKYSYHHLSAVKVGGPICRLPDRASDYFWFCEAKKGQHRHGGWFNKSCLWLCCERLTSGRFLIQIYQKFLRRKKSTVYLSDRIGSLESPLNGLKAEVLLVLQENWKPIDALISIKLSRCKSPSAGSWLFLEKSPNAKCICKISLKYAFCWCYKKFLVLTQE